MFDTLSQKLEQAIKSLKGQGRISDINVATTIKEIRKALMEADVHYKIAKEVTDEIKQKALGQNVLTAVSPGQLLTKITQDELTILMGTHGEEIKLDGSPSVILIAGLQGSGKTTFSGKLARHLKSQGRQVLLVACDVYRPAAIEQLKILGQQIGIDVYTELDNNDPVKIALAAVAFAKKTSKQVVIVDTAGRLAIDVEMMKEITQIKKSIHPSETLFVVDAMMGQDAVNTAQAFNEQLNFDGVVLTKLDGDSRGGAALSIRRVVDKPIKFISSGEKLETLERFYPDRMASRILGMGDIVSLVEKAQATYDGEQASILQRKFRKNQFTLSDFLSQLDQIKKMGNIKDLLSMVPGANKAIKNMDITADTFKPTEAIIRSMTTSEKENPEILNPSRKSRIAAGSGTSIQQINQLLRQFDQMKQMMKSMNKSPRR